MSDSEETIQCTNCKHDILPSNFTIHFVHCKRNFYLCKKCKNPVNFNDKTKHENEDHLVTYCRNCHVQLEKWLLKEHLAKDCPYRKVKCQICDIEVEATQIKEHENYCGSRTEKCPECGEFVMLRYKSLHVESNHTFIKLSDEPGPSPSWQNGRRTLCNFMPDLSSKNYKPVTSHKRRSGESRKSRTDSYRSRNLSESDEYLGTSPNKNDNNEFRAKKNDVRENRKSFKKEFEEWPALSSLTQLDTSEDNRRSSITNGINRTEPDEESDLMFAIQFSEQLNFHMKGKEKKSSTSGANHDLNKLFTSNKKKDLDLGVNLYNNNDSDDDVFPISNKINKYLNDGPVKLPCEFCGTLIESHDLIFHQTRCRILMRESFGNTNLKYKYSCLTEDIEKKVPCGICNKFFKLSALENHQLHCQKNLSKSWKSQEKGNYTKNIKSIKGKSEPGLQNGVEPSSPRLTRMGTRSEWLSELSKASQDEETALRRNNLNYPENGVGARPKLSRKSRRAPSPPKM